MHWEFITNIILASAFSVLAVFAALGIYQLVQRKSLKKVDKNLTTFLIPLALLAVIYFVFDHLWVINLRPNGSGEPSFPSTHVLIVATVFLLAAQNLPALIPKKPHRLALYVVMALLTLITAIGRVASEMHWLTDVIAALVFSLILAVIYYIINHPRKGQKEQKP